MNYKIASPKGRYKDKNTFQDTVGYITRDNACDPNHIITRNIKDVSSIAEEMAETTNRSGKNHGTRVRHTIISFGDRDHATVEKAKKVAESACDYYGGDYQVVAAIHQNTEHLHIHMIMNTTDIHTGKKYQGKKKDYFAFENHIRKTAKRHGMRFEGRIK